MKVHYYADDLFPVYYFNREIDPESTFPINDIPIEMIEEYEAARAHLDSLTTKVADFLNAHPDTQT